MAKHIYLRKANDDFVSHCECAKADALISSPGQMDCPWCVCIEGWHSHHDLDFVPQVAAMDNPDIRNDVLCSREYWQSNRVESEQA